jgi:hypothetical protein
MPREAKIEDAGTNKIEIAVFLVPAMLLAFLLGRLRDRVHLESDRGLCRQSAFKQRPTG